MQDNPFQKKWKYKGLDTELCRRLGKETGLHEIIISLLTQRGLQTSKDIDDFLQPKLNQLPSPFLLKGMEQAVALLDVALKKKQPVAIFGDFDADGLTATAVLSLFLQKLGLTVFTYHPERIADGYGLNLTGIKLLYEKCQREGGVNPLLITVDCGISGHEEIKAARQLGFQVIITDHHQPPENLPEADAVINPHQPGCDFPFKELAGVGVAFNLAMGFRSRLHASGFWSGNMEGAPSLINYLDIVAIGTIADVVPILGPNRIFVKAGLEILAGNKRPGIKALMHKAGIASREINELDVAYQICPRLNSPGRLGSSKNAYDILITDSTIEAECLAEKIENENEERKLLAENVVRDVIAKVSKKLLDSRMALVFHDKNWHPGVIGIASSRIMNEYNRPTLLLTNDHTQQFARGSGRSVSGLDLFDILSRCSSFLLRFGGHQAAAGMAITLDQLEDFKECLEQEMVNRMVPADLQPEIWIDFSAPLKDLFSLSFLDEYQKMAPFGTGNPEPVFSTENGAQLNNPKKVGQGSLRFQLKENGSWYNGFGFGFGLQDELFNTQDISIAFHIRRNFFQGKRTWEIRAEDMRANHTSITSTT